MEARREILAEGVEVWCGDCREILPTLGKFDLCASDPPYGIDFDTDYTRFTTGHGVKRTTHKAVANDAEPFDPAHLLTFPKVVLFGANCFSDRLPKGSWLIWDKRFKNGQAFLADGEAAWLSSGYGVYIFSKTSQGFVRPEPIEHPTQKPVDVMMWCIEKAGPAASVIDPYMGVGSTGVAAVKLGRRFTGIEIEPTYFDIACRRIEAAAREPYMFAEEQEPEQLSILDAAS